ncbi:NERD domain-containing protein [Peribacillus saganii]|uniref:NERD domain-containing protein n=1 Tax=Peribacillus saganii TaxID=2303992 RepID=A0A372LP25_9BACI|nr:NERD domain-containing protein [Peribacillus saganii]RFU68723.1 NERD domain-containing protein [Peribacillus saganii]
MGQLIKLQDYISRYEQDIYRYPTQFARLKKQQWTKLKEAYSSGELKSVMSRQQEAEEPGLLAEEKTGLLSRVKGLFKKNGTNEEIEPAERDVMEKPDNELSVHIPFQPESLEELKQAFLNQLLRFQMKWGSSTLHERSLIDQSYYFDEKLRFFLQRFPDTFLLLYKPIFLLKNAPVEVEVILLSPTDAWCITFMEAEDDAVFLGDKEKFWIKRHHKRPDKKVLSPLLSVNRTEKIVKQIFALYDVQLPIKKAIISRNGYIDYPLVPYDISLLDKRKFSDWFQRMRTLSSPLKHQQLKAAQALLDYCQTTSSLRIEWGVEPNEQDDEPQK